MLINEINSLKKLCSSPFEILLYEEKFLQILIKKNLLFHYFKSKKTTSLTKNKKLKIHFVYFINLVNFVIILSNIIENFEVCGAKIPVLISAMKQIENSLPKKYRGFKK